MPADTKCELGVETLITTAAATADLQLDMKHDLAGSAASGYTKAYFVSH